MAKMARPFVMTDTMIGKIDAKEGVRKRLLPFIKQHNNTVIFWTDLASCHYSAHALEWYETNNVTCVRKEMNTPNCPEIRHIETFWALTKRIRPKTGLKFQERLVQCNENGQRKHCTEAYE